VRADRGVSPSLLRGGSLFARAQFGPGYFFDVMCPGTPFPVRPWLPLPMCRTCPLYEFGHAMTGPATHDGKRWSCPKYQPADLGDSPKVDHG